MASYEIPLSPEAQTFSIDLAGTTYQLTLLYNNFAPSWTLDIADSTGNAILSGLPLVANVDLLAQYGYLDFGGQLIAQTDGNVLAAPTFDNLGIAGHLYFVTP